MHTRHALWTRRMSVLAEMDEINCEKLKVLDFVVLVCMPYQCHIEVPISAH